MILPSGDKKYDDSTMIFNKTQTDIYPVKKDKGNQNALVLKDASSIEHFPISETQELSTKAQELKVNNIIKSQKRQIDYLKSKLKSVTRTKVKNVQRSSDLEKLFMSCVEEVKKEVTKRRTLSSVRTKRELKGSFCNQDKIKILEKFVTNETLLSQIYQNIFDQPKEEGKEIPFVQETLKTFSPDVEDIEKITFDPLIDTKKTFMQFKTSRVCKPLSSGTGGKTLSSKASGYNKPKFAVPNTSDDTRRPSKRPVKLIKLPKERSQGRNRAQKLGLKPLYHTHR